MGLAWGKIIDIFMELDPLPKYLNKKPKVFQNKIQCRKIIPPVYKDYDMVD